MKNSYSVFAQVTILAVSVLVGVACNLVPGLTPAVRPVSALTPDDLLAAIFSPADVQKLLPNPQNWWPYFPQFNVGIGDQSPGLRFYVAQVYQQVGELSKSQAETTLLLYDDEAAAARDFSGRLLEINDKGAELISGSAVGDESRYFTRLLKDQDNPYESTLRFRVGPIVGRLSLLYQLGYEKPEALARYAEPVIQKVRALLNGSLSATPLPERLGTLMPPPSAATAIGPVQGSVASPVESWALLDTSGNPEAVRDQLKRLGATELGFRRYSLQADLSHVIEVTLFPFTDAPAATTWVGEFIEEARKQRTLDAGKTGELSAFVDWGDSYELQFAKGRYLGDVFCNAPFDKTSSKCEAPVRQLAEAWYAALPTR